jgi:hypothetical protein
MAVAVGICRIEEGQLLHAQRGLEFLKIAGKAHFPELFKPAGAIERRHPKGDRGAPMINDERAMNGPADGEWFIAQ